ncbi:MAG: transporter substrate-binding domain-containing protein, partial [Alphaproteobacteria bacterium]|nr:transporter substrate-binding domain-containing protein [Alphaproteobacteria bacterium]
MLRIFAILGLVCLLTLPAFPVQADPSSDSPGKVLRIVVTENVPPFSQREPAGSLSGFNVDIARKLCQHLHAECTLETQPLAALIEAVAAGRHDIGLGNLLRTPDPERRLL